MFEVPEEDRKVFLEYLSRRPYIEVAALIARIAGWKKEGKEEKVKQEKHKKIQPEAVFFSCCSFWPLRCQSGNPQAAGRPS